jgi:hypothetical protein
MNKINYPSMGAILAYLNQVYDILSFFLSIFDVISDILITREFYLQERWSFFYISVAIFFIAQLCYSCLFLALYDDAGSIWQKIIQFCMIFPIAQAVPAIIWLQSFNFAWLDKLFRLLKLRVHKPPATPSVQPNKLKAFINRKLLTSGGFLVESVVESIPQCLLQMVAIVTLGFSQLSTLQLVSFLLSLISIASKSVVGSYSFHYPTFIFNIFCFITDLFAVFCLVSWLFLPITPEISHLAPLNSLWYIKETILISIILTFLLSLAVMAIADGIHSGVIHWRNLLQRSFHVKVLGSAAICMAGLLLAGPFLCFIEATKFALLPLLLCQPIEQKFARFYSYYVHLFDFLYSRNDYSTHGAIKINNSYATIKKKLGVVNSEIARRLEKWGSVHLYSMERDLGKERTEKLMASLPQYKALATQEFNFTKFRELNGSTMAEYWRSYVKLGGKEASQRQRAAHAHYNSLSSFYVEYFLAYFMPYVAVPVPMLCQFYSWLYPLACFALTPRAHIPTLQYSLSVCLMGLYLILALCSLPAIQFRLIHFHMWDGTRILGEPSTGWVKQMQRVFVQQYDNNTAAIVLAVANARANHNSEIKNSMDNLIPLILEYGEMAVHSSDAPALKQFIAHSNTFKALAADKPKIKPKYVKKVKPKSRRTLKRD